MPQGWTAGPAPTDAWTPGPAPAANFSATNEKDASGNAVVASMSDRALDVAKDVGAGFVKGVGQTVFNAGRLARKVPLLGSALDAAAKAVGPEGTDPAQAFAQQPPELAPHGVAQHVGQFVETLAEMAATGKVQPGVAAELTSAVAKYLPKAAKVLPRVVEAGRAAGQAVMHGENPLTAGALGAVLPGTAAVVGEDTAQALRSSAEKNIAQALGPTKERFKALAERRAGEMLDRGVPGALGTSREALLQTAREHTNDIGKQIGALIEQHADQAVPTTPILGAIEAAKAEFQHVVTKGGESEAVSFVPRAVKQLDGLKDILSQYGDTMRVDQAVAVRRAWDKIVADAGGFAHRSGSAFGVALKDASEAATKRTATSAIRNVLNDAVPDLAALDKEYAFWRDLQNITTATLKRTQAQKPGIGAEIAGAAGGAVGAAMGGAVGLHAGGMEAGFMGSAAGAFATKKIAEMAHAAFTSPRWAFVKASAKNELAEAITNGQAQRVGLVLGRILSVEGAAGVAAVGQ